MQHSEDSEEGGRLEGGEPVLEYENDGMEISDTELASTGLQRDNKLLELRKDGTSSAWPNSSKKYLQNDGRKVHIADTGHNFGDMSRAARATTFTNFPKKALSAKIMDSGYFYTGRDDRTICHKCNAVVFDWKEKDDPATFHEAHCEYHQVVSLESEQKEKFEDAYSSQDNTPSIMDASVTEFNSNVPLPPVTLSPTFAPSTQVHGEVKIVAAHEGNKASVTEHQSVPAFELSSVAQSPLLKKFVGKQQRSIISSITVSDKGHKKYLETLNLNSEEDRRKTFLFHNCWKQNTNNVLDPLRLASNGFFYLGNLDRTQCFSCRKIFKTWQRHDRIAKVHQRNVPYCKMALGKDNQNIPIPNWKPEIESLSPPSSVRSSIEPSVMLSSSGPVSTSVPRDPEESALEISEPSYFGHGSQDFNIDRLQNVLPPIARQETSQRRSNQTTEPTNSPPEVPMDLTVGKEPLGATAAPGTGSSSKFRDGNILHRNIPPTIKIGEHLPMQISMEDEEQQGAGDVSPSAETLTIPNLPPASVSWHLGQTTLYNTTRSMETSPPAEQPTVLPSPTEVQPVPIAAQGEWAEVFPCNDPAHPHMRSTVTRQETFGFQWMRRGIENTDDIARAGFFCFDEDDTRCWYCNRSRHWNRGDNPWEQHVRLNANCEYLLQQKGPAFVSEVASRQPPTPPPPPRRSPVTVRRIPSYAPSISPEDSPFSSLEGQSITLPRTGSPQITIFGHRIGTIHRRHGSSPPRVVDPREELLKFKRTLETSLNSEVAFQAMEMGFDMKTIKKAMKRKIRNSDLGFQNAESLLEALLTQSPNLSDSSDSDEEGPAPSTSGTATTPGMGAQSTQSFTGAHSNIPGSSGAQGGSDPGHSVLEGAGNLDPRDLDKKLREYEQEKRCKVCLDRDAEVVFVPCGHLCTCVDCAGVLRNCPLCRKKITKSMKIYTS